MQSHHANKALTRMSVVFYVVVVLYFSQLMTSETAEWSLSKVYQMFGSTSGTKQVKLKGKCEFVWRLVVNTPLRRSGMARVLKGSPYA